MTRKQQASQKIFDVLFKGINFQAEEPNFNEQASLMTKIYRSSVMQKIEEIISEVYGEE